MTLISGAAGKDVIMVDFDHTAWLISKGGVRSTSLLYVINAHLDGAKLIEAGWTSSLEQKRDWIHFIVFFLLKIF